VSFFYFGKKAAKSAIGGLSLDLMHKGQCQVCPLNHQPGLLHPHMDPSGSSKPIVYILGEAPGEQEDKKGEPFVGKAGKALRLRIPRKWLPDIRFNNVVRTRPLENRDPTQVEMECCRPSIIADIERTKPKAIFGFGNIPLTWAIGRTGITNWAGRWMPIKVGAHSCWYFPFMHPSAIMRGRKFEPRDANSYGSDQEFAFAKDLERAFELVDYLPEPIVHSTEDALEGIEVVTDASEVADRLYDAINVNGLVGIDFETNCLRPYKEGAKILSCAISNREGTFSFPLRHPENNWTDTELNNVEDALADFLHDVRGRKVAHRLPFEMEWACFFFGKTCAYAGEWGDSESQAYILDERRGMHSLEALCLQYFGFDIKAIDNLDRKNLEKAPLDKVLSYNALDAKYHRLLYIEQQARIEEEKLEDVYEHQLARVPAAVLLQIKGVPVDQEEAERFKQQYEDELDQIEEEIDTSTEGKAYKRLTGKYYRPGAPQDTIKMMASILKRPIDSADEKALAPIKHPVVDLTIRWRKANKLLSTYVLPCIESIYPDGQLHHALNLTSTRTWRTSAEDPNIQNFPKRQELAKDVRRQIKPASGWKVVSFDFAGIQARNIAMESEDEALVDSFWNDYDIHGDWAKKIADAFPDWENADRMDEPSTFKALRHRAKNQFIFPSFFGAYPKKLANGLDVPEDLCKELQDELWEMFPSVHAWQQRLINGYEETGYVVGLSGFRRRAPISQNELINAPIQADEAIIVCDAMIRISRLADRMKEWLLQPAMEIHDDLTFFWPEDAIEELTPIVAKEMTKLSFPWINVPLVIEQSIGDDWADMKEVAKFSSEELWNHRRRK
jgi:uracil-DNA glycosylase family 4